MELKYKILNQIKLFSTKKPSNSTESDKNQIYRSYFQNIQQKFVFIPQKLLYKNKNKLYHIFD